MRLCGLERCSRRRWLCVRSGFATAEKAAKIAVAEAGLAAATTQYDRDVFARIREEYRRYAAERTRQIAKTAAASDGLLSD